MDEDEIIATLERRLKRATDLLREWRDKHGGREVYVVKGTSDNLLSASQTDLGRETQRFLEGRE